ncbi:MAG: M15 family metallopeptidase [Candidatus Omnitrophota bacterium]
MNRRSFILASCSTLAVSASRSVDEISELELAGKKRPPLAGKDVPLRPSAAEAYMSMRKAALTEGIKIHIVSGYRSFDRQLRIWNRKYRSMNKTKMTPEEKFRSILQYSSLPGTSRHHWGTDADLVDLSQPKPEEMLLERHYKKGGVYGDMYSWLMGNAEKYGFYETYTNDSSRTGYAYEPWHWSFAEDSIPFLRKFITIDLRKFVCVREVEGFSSFTPHLMKEFTEKWIKGVNPILFPNG